MKLNYVTGASLFFNKILEYMNALGDSWHKLNPPPYTAVGFDRYCTG